MKLSLPPRRAWGFTAATILFGLWLLLQIQGWYFVLRAHSLERKLVKLRPALSAIVLSEQLEKTRAQCLSSFEEIRRAEIPAVSFLERLSHRLPPSVTLETVSVHPMLGWKIQGSFFAGKRDPERTVALLASHLAGEGLSFKVRSIFPDPKDSSLWHFELKG